MNKERFYERYDKISKALAACEHRWELTCLHPQGKQLQCANEQVCPLTGEVLRQEFPSDMSGKGK